jgi:HSP20 family protein
MPNIVRFDPFEDLTRLQREVNRLFDDSGRAPARANGGTEHAAQRAWAPSVDIFEDNNEIVVKTDLPGVKQEDIDIELTGETLTIKGERKFEDTQRADKYLRVERSYGSFQRSFTVGVPIDQDKIKASFNAGVLEVHLPKSELNRPKKITVAAE